MPIEAPLRAKPQLIAGAHAPSRAYEADIVILSLNRLADTMEAIRSALAQTYVSLHVIVLDQGSEPDMLAQLHRAFGQGPRFALYAIGSNLGVAAGRNLANALGRGETIISLDNDAVFAATNVVSRACSLLRNKPELGAVGFAILDRDGKDADRASWGYPTRLLPKFRQYFETTTFVGAGHAIRRGAWETAGGYDQTLFFTWEEYDFCLRLIFRGWRIGYDGRLAVLHKGSSEGRIGWHAERTRLFVRNRLIISRKWGASWFALLPRMLGYVVKGLVNKTFRASWAGIRAAIAASPQETIHMPKEMKAYILTREGRFRGSWWERLNREVFVRYTRPPGSI